MKNNFPSQGDPVTILLVEDNQDHAELVKRSFANYRDDNDLYHVSDGAEALDYLFRRGAYADADKSPRPRLILLDLRLPKIDGFEVLKEIKASEKLRKIPVVALTSSDKETDAAKAYDEHVNSYLVKSLDFAKFDQMIEQIAFYWLTWNYYPWPEK